jgi:hypothetical protein
VTTKEFFQKISIKGYWFLAGAAFILLYITFCEIFIASESTVKEQISNTTVANPLLKGYVIYFPYLWYSIFILVFIGLFKPFKESFATSKSLTIQLAIAITLTLSFLFVSLIFLSRLSQSNDGYYTVLIGVFSVISVSIGWMINTQVARDHQRRLENITHHNHKRSHTLNVIFELNLSKDFHDKLQIISEFYPYANGSIKEGDIEMFLSPTIVANTDDEKKRMNAISTYCILLDTYEFICEGIAQKDLDEKVIYQAIGGTLLRNRKRGRDLILAVQRGTYSEARGKVFCKFVEYTDKWEDRHAREEQDIAKTHR